VKKLQPPSGNAELREMVRIGSGLSLAELEQILEMELSGGRRGYVAYRLAMRINKLHSERRMIEVMHRLGEYR